MIVFTLLSFFLFLPDTMKHKPKGQGDDGMGKYIRRLLPLFTISSLFVLLLSFIPMGNYPLTNKEISVFQSTEDKVFNDRSIVDYFANYPLRCNISHIEWKNGVLYLELHRLSNEEELYKDIFLILKECFVRRENVNMVRFAVQSKEKGIILEAKKEDVVSDSQMEGREQNTSYKEYLTQLFKFNEDD